MSAFGKSPVLNKPALGIENFANGTSAVYIDQMYEMWKQDPQSVHSSWRAYFEGVDSGAETPYQAPPSLGKDSKSAMAGAPANMDAIIQALRQSGIMDGASFGTSAADATNIGEVHNDAIKIMSLCRAYMNYGHLSAKVDPLNLEEVFAEHDLGKKYGSTSLSGNYLIDFKHWGLSEADLDRTFYIDVPMLGGLL